MKSLLISCRIPSDFDTQLQEALNDGWEIHGNLATCAFPDDRPYFQHYVMYSILLIKKQ